MLLALLKVLIGIVLAAHTASFCTEWFCWEPFSRNAFCTTYRTLSSALECSVTKKRKKHRPHLAHLIRQISRPIELFRSPKRRQAKTAFHADSLFGDGKGIVNPSAAYGNQCSIE